VTVLTAREGYRLWAPRYEAETAISALEDLTVRGLKRATAGKALLDVGCGTGRRLRNVDAAIRVGIDLSPDMLLSGGASANVATGDALALPFATASFDVVWCRLVIGHLRAFGTCYRELARVARIGGTVVVSDLCPEAIAAGHRRTFRDGTGAVYELEHFIHSRTAHESAAEHVGLEMEACVDGAVGPDIKDFYMAASREALYESQRGTKLVRVFCWRRLGGPS